MAERWVAAAAAGGWVACAGAHACTVEVLGGFGGEGGVRRRARLHNEHRPAHLPPSWPTLPYRRKCILEGLNFRQAAHGTSPSGWADLERTEAGPATVHELMQDALGVPPALTTQVAAELKVREQRDLLRGGSSGIYRGEGAGDVLRGRSGGCTEGREQVL